MILALVEKLMKIGICVYELLIGNVPFIKNTIKKTKEDILKGIFDYPKDINISFESISFINSLLQYDPKKRLSWDKFWKHPFLTKDVTKFHPLKLTLDLNNTKIFENLENLKVDSKRTNNFLWFVYKDGSEVGFELDKIDDNFMKTKFNENYFSDPDDEKENEIFEEINNNDYSFIDLSGKDNKNKIPEFDYEVYGKYVERTSGDWEIISVDSEDI